MCPIKGLLTFVVWQIKKQSFFPLYRNDGLLLCGLRDVGGLSAARISYFPWCSSLTVSFLRPCARREASTRRPFFVDIRSRKPCLFTRRRLWGWKVLFILFLRYLIFYVNCLRNRVLMTRTPCVCNETLRNSGCKITYLFLNTQEKLENKAHKRLK